ncbi:hypothetical protein D3C85_1818830 [compost metagenome]
MISRFSPNSGFRRAGEKTVAQLGATDRSNRAKTTAKPATAPITSPVTVASATPITPQPRCSPRKIDRTMLIPLINV